MRSFMPARLVLGLACTCTSVLAQQAPTPAPLPPIVVEGQKKAAPKRPIAKQAVPAVTKAEPAPKVENPKGRVEGVVAKSSVTGSKTGTPISEIPQGISVIGRDQIDTLGATTVGEATRYAPGIRSETFGADSRNDWFLIRGFSAQETGLYLDGLQLFTTAFATWKVEPQGLERIEILRGPSSVLYGGGNPGGLVNAVSKRPDPDAKQSVTTGVDSYGSRFGALDIGGRMAGTDGVSYRLNMLGRFGETQVDDVINDRFFIAPSVAFKVNSNTSVVLLASYQHDKTAIQNFLPYVGTVVNAPFGKIPTSLDTNNPGYGQFTRDQLTLGYEVEHKASSDTTLRQNFRYGHLSVELLGLYGLGYSATPTATDGTISRGNFITKPVVNQFTVDNQIEHRFLSGPVAHKFLVGLDYKNYRIDDEQGFAFRFADLNLANPVYPTGIVTPSTRYLLATTTQQQLGAYVQDQMKIERLTIALSGRHDWVDTAREDQLSASGTQRNNESAYSGRVGAIYNLPNGVSPYISYSTSFNPLVGLNSATSSLLTPERGEGWEAGVKYEPKFMNARFTASYFDIARTNVPVTNPATFAVSQIGKVTSKGWEFEALANPVAGLKLIASYTTYDLNNVSDVDLTAVGKVPVGVPEQFGGIFVDYTMQEGVLKGWGLGGGARYTGKSYANVSNTLEVPSIWLGDATVHYEWKGWRTALNVTNLFDDVYVGSCSSADACFYGERREAMLTATYKW